MITLYDLPMSGNAHRVRLFLNMLGLEYEHKIVNFADGEHKSEAYLKINPLGQVPALEDDGDIFRDSCAILIYLANTYDDAGKWCGNTAAEKAHIQEWLAISGRELFFGPAAARAAKVFGRELDFEKASADAHRLFGEVFDPHLSSHKWLAADRPTIADIANYSYVARAPEGQVMLDDYPNVRRWLKDVEALPGFVAMIKAGD